MRKGQCHCGTVRFEFDGEPSEVSYCHCSLCRKMSGSAFGTYIEVANKDFRILSGEDRLARYNLTGRMSKRFCEVCGTTLYSEHTSFPGFVYIGLGVIDDPRGIVPTMHQFVGSKAPWFDIHDDLPQFDEWSDV